MDGHFGSLAEATHCIEANSNCTSHPAAGIVMELSMNRIRVREHGARKASARRTTAQTINQNLKGVGCGKRSA